MSAVFKNYLLPPFYLLEYSKYHHKNCMSVVLNTMINEIYTWLLFNICMIPDSYNSVNDTSFCFLSVRLNFWSMSHGCRML